MFLDADVFIPTKRFILSKSSSNPSDDPLRFRYPPVSLLDQLIPSKREERRKERKARFEGSNRFVARESSDQIPIEEGGWLNLR